MNGRRPRPIIWVASSKEDLKALSEEVQDHIGFALYQAQIGLKHRDAKPLKGLGSGVFEVVSAFRGDAYRAVYSVGFPEVVYVLHVFQKKSRKRIATPRAEIDLVRRRFSRAARHYAESFGKGAKR